MHRTGTGGDIIGIADAQHLTAGDTGVAGHHRDADGQADIAQALTQDRAQKHSQDQHGHSHHGIHDTHDEGIHHTACHAGDQAQCHADDAGNDHSHDTDRKGDAGTIDDAAQNITAIGVGASQCSAEQPFRTL